MDALKQNKALVPAKKLQIIEAAYGLFRANGFYATGVDLIMRTAEVSKRTMYKYFPTKNDLIAATLDYYQANYKVYLENLLDHKEMNSREKILLIFTDAMTWFDDTNFHGCLAVNAMSEFSGKDDLIENTCVNFKRWELGMLCDLTKDIDNKQPIELAHKLFVLLEGMVSIAKVNHSPYLINMTQMADEVINLHLSNNAKS